MEKQSDEDWMITFPLNAPADKTQVENLAEDLSELPYEKVVETESPDFAKYGIPTQTIRLYYENLTDPVVILIGEKNPLDNTYFAKLGSENRVVLLPGRLSTTLEKELTDLRKKDIFAFDIEEAASLSVTSPETGWTVEKEGEKWFLTDPVSSLADKTGIQNVLNALSGLTAEDFVSENKTEAEMETFGLDSPSYHAELDLPGKNKKLHFYLNKQEDKTYATSNDSGKIVTVADTTLSQLDKPVSELRETSVADFYAWEVKRIQLEGPELTLEAVKDKEDVWHLDSTNGPEAEKQTIEDFIRKISYLEAEEFVDPPYAAGKYGITGDVQKLTITVAADEGDEADIITLLLGNQLEEEGPVFVKNQNLDYLFQVDSEFMQNYPSSREDWLKPEAESKEEKEPEGKMN